MLKKFVRFGFGFETLVKIRSGFGFKNKQSLLVLVEPSRLVSLKKGAKLLPCDERGCAIRVLA